MGDSVSAQSLSGRRLRHLHQQSGSRHDRVSQVGKCGRYSIGPGRPTGQGRWAFRAECLAKKPYGAKALALVTCEELASLDRVHYRERLEVG